MNGSADSHIFQPKTNSIVSHFVKPGKQRFSISSVSEGILLQRDRRRFDYFASHLAKVYFYMDVPCLFLIVFYKPKTLSSSLTI